MSNGISRIGIGTYRMSIDNSEHYDSMVYALRNGCNLIDTASNYFQGKSELLVGKVLHDYPEFSPIIVTKTGYLDRNETFRFSGESLSEKVYISEGFEHSIHPDFINYKLSSSLTRMRKEKVDVFLLHNPEYYFKGSDKLINPEIFYSRIKRAFEFLEQKVTDKKIGFYGVSSNSFPFSTALEGTINLNRLLELASNVSSNHHFRFIQFPFNLLEKEALKEHHDGRSIISIAKENNITILGNRPFNATVNGKPFRLATYSSDLGILDSADQVISSALDMINEKLFASGVNQQALEFPVMQFFFQNWKSWGGEAKVKAIYKEHVYPFFLEVYGGHIPEKSMKIFMDLQSISMLFARRIQSDKAKDLMEKLVKDNILIYENGKSLSYLAASKYLDWGIDSVLVGMRKQQYVDDMKDLF